MELQATRKRRFWPIFSVVSSRRAAVFRAAALDRHGSDLEIPEPVRFLIPNLQMFTPLTH